MQAVQALNGQQTLSPEEFTDLVFHKIDINNDGKAITLLGLTLKKKIYKVVDGGEGMPLGKSMNLSRKS